MHVVTHEYVGQTVERCCEQGKRSCFTCDEFISGVLVKCPDLSHKLEDLTSVASPR